MKINEFKQSIPFLFKAGLVPLIIGRHGVGKSQGVKQWCDENGYNMIDLRLGQMSDAGDILGLPDFTADAKGNKVATKFMRPSWLPTTPKNVIFLDEINRAPKDIMQAIFQLVLDKRIHEYKLPEDCYVIAAANPNTEDYQTFDFIFTEQALVDRFVHIKLEPSKDEFFEHARKTGMNTNVLAFLQEHDKHVNTDIGKFSLEYVKGSNRTFDAISRLENQNMPESLLKECMFGMVGVETALQYIAHKNDNMNKIKADIVLNDWKKAEAIVTKFSAQETNRNDVLKIVCDDLKALVAETLDNGDLTAKQIKNFKAFFMTIPKDLAKAALIDTLTSVEKLSNVKEIVEDSDFVNHF